MGVGQKKNFYLQSKKKYAHFSANIHSFSNFFFKLKFTLGLLLASKNPILGKIVDVKVYGNLNAFAW